MADLIPKKWTDPSVPTASSFASGNKLAGLVGSVVTMFPKSVIDAVYAALVHAARHKASGADEILLDELGAPTDVTTLNRSTSAHGLAKKLPNIATQFEDGTGTWRQLADSDMPDGLWVPTTPATPYAWYKADAGVYTDAGTTLATDTQTVQQWNDQSGNSRHLSQATSGKRPVYRTGIINSLPVVRFAGTDDCMQATSISLSTFTIGVVFRVSNSGLIYEHGADINSNPGSYIHTAQSSSFIARRSATVSGRNISASWGNQNEWMSVVHQFASGNHDLHKLLVNGSWVLAATDGGAGGSDPGTGAVSATLNVGARNNGASLAIIGDILELVIYTTALSFIDASRLGQYLARRANISGA